MSFYGLVVAVDVAVAVGVCVDVPVWVGVGVVLGTGVSVAVGVMVTVGVAVGVGVGTSKVRWMRFSAKRSASVLLMRMRRVTLPAGMSFRSQVWMRSGFSYWLALSSTSGFHSWGSSPGPHRRLKSLKFPVALITA